MNDLKKGYIVLQTKKLIIFFVFVGFYLLLNSRELIIGGRISQQSRYFDEETQEYKGYDIELIDYIMKRLVVPYKIILENSSTRLEHGWKIDVPWYDMVFTYSYNQERTKYLTYSSESHREIDWNFFIRIEDKNKYIFEDFDDLKGLKIGFTRGQSYTPEFLESIEKGILHIDEVVREELQMPKLLGGRIDIVPLSTQSTLLTAKEEGYLHRITYLPKPLKSEKYYNTFVKNSDYPHLDDLIKRYDQILREMKEDGTLEKIRQKYGL